MNMSRVLLTWLTLSVAACTVDSDVDVAQHPARRELASEPPIDPQRGAIGRERTLHLLTYNVAGLPQWLSKSTPRENLPRIGGLVNAYDLVLLQEDFAYPDLLRRNTHFRWETHRCDRPTMFALGDGLSRFAKHAVRAEAHVAWRKCSGYLYDFSDCLTKKGFSMATHVLPDGAEIDIYNVHFDAGSAASDLAARRVQAEQLALYVLDHSRAKAIVIAGDSNMRLSRDQTTFLALLRWTGTQDACFALDCPQKEAIDRVLFRSSPEVRLRPVAWQEPQHFVGLDGAPLSDHLPVSVTFQWSRALASDASQ
jgi:endonuclease/exonuclease/phosphatase family metal-dependent hydrolase